MSRLLLFFMLSAVAACKRTAPPEPPPETCPAPPGVLILDEPGPASLPEPWRFRVTVTGLPHSLPPRAIPVGMTIVPRGTTREIPVEGVLEGSDGTSVTGYLAEEPPDGACVRLGYLQGALPPIGRYRRATSP